MTAAERYHGMKRAHCVRISKSANCDGMISILAYWLEDGELRFRITFEHPTALERRWGVPCIWHKTRTAAQDAAVADGGV